MKAILTALAILTMTVCASAQTSKPAAPKPAGLTGYIGVDVPLSDEAAQPVTVPGAQGEASFSSPRAFVTLRYQPVSFWFGRITAYRYFNADEKASWNPDFTYSFGYDDWHPGKLAVTYDNYGGNRFNPRAGERVTRFEEGTVTGIYRLNIPKGFQAHFGPRDGDNFTASAGVHLTPRFTQENHAERGRWKRKLSFGVRDRFYKSWYVEARGFYYPTQSQQQPWDPDFTYGFGYFDWHPGTISVQYNNYAGNRFPGHDRRGSGGFGKGAVTLFYSRAW